MTARSVRVARATKDVRQPAAAARPGAGPLGIVPRASAAANEEPAAIVRADFARIIRVDDTRREIELCATSEAIDSHGTVFGYEASKDAFTRWAGNVREMHERKAVGRRIAVRFQDTERRIYVRVRISQGAQDTWEKILDGTLRGASIGASNVEWRHERRAGRTMPVAQRYDLVELSLVDLPSNPDALGIAVVRDGVPVLDQLDVLPELLGDSGDVAPVDVAAADAGGDAQGTLAAGRAIPDGSRAARLAALGAPDYVARAAEPAADRAAPQASRMRGPFSSNHDGPPDVGVPARAEESPTGEDYGQRPEGNRADVFHDAARAILLGCGCPLCAAALAVLAGGDEPRDDVAGRLALATVTRALEGQTQRLDDALSGLRGMRDGLAHVAGTLEQIERRVAAIEDQPLPGGPQLRAAEKTSALQPDATGAVGEQLRALQGLAGRLSDPQAQIAVATEMIRLQQQAAGLSQAMQAMPRAGGHS